MQKLDDLGNETWKDSEVGSYEKFKLKLKLKLKLNKFWVFKSN